MPPLLTVTTAQVTLVYSGDVFDSGGGATVLGFRRETTWGGTDLNEFAAIVGEAWTDFLSTGVSDHVTLASVRAVSDAVGGEVDVGSTGAITGDTTPPNTALLVNYKTSYRGPRGRGRSFFPGMTFENTTNDDGTLDSAWRIGQQARIDGFFDQVETEGDVIQVIIQNSEGTSEPLTPSPPVTARIVDGMVASQRRRLRR